jgi:uroporphyrin-III C-methyltransferase
MLSGRRGDEPVAVISKATTPAQRVLESTLREIGAAAGAIEAPAIVVVGEVVRLRAALGWVGALDGPKLYSGSQKRHLVDPFSQPFR